jgi:hypothetical protein
MVPFLSTFKKHVVALNNLCTQLQKEFNSYMTYKHKNRPRPDGVYQIVKEMKKHKNKD